MNLALAICGLCVLAVLWTLVGFPLWLARNARRVPSQVASGDFQPMVTAIIPVYNGARFLAAKLDSVLGSDYPAERLDILVVSDGSTDATEQIAERYRATGRVRCIVVARRGKAAALTDAFQCAEREVLLLTDVRQVLDAQCVRLLMRRLHDPAVGVVSGHLRIRRGETSGEAGTGLYWRYESWIRANLGRIDSLLGATGPIYAMRRAFARPLPAGCILDDVWLPYQAILEGKRSVLADDAIAWDYPTGLETEFNRKVRTQAGLYQLLKQERRLLMPGRNRLFWSFLNLKMGRLLMPHVLIAFLVASFWLPHPLDVISLALQALFYGTYFVDRRLAETSPLKRAVAPVSAFVTLMAAAFCAQAVFFRDPSTLWKTTQVRVTTSGE